MELPPEVYERIAEISEQGNLLLDQGLVEEALSEWSKALDLVPDPKSDWEASTWLLASMGDALYQRARFSEASARLRDALNCPGGQGNPFIHYRLGQAEKRLGRDRSSVEHLLRAYMLAGDEIFINDSEGEEFLGILRTKGLLSGASR